jgi:deoxyribodipyrimidine photo-lyase
VNKALFWHRRDLRMQDNAGLYKALRAGKQVQPIFIFDRNILDKLPTNDQRVLFIHQQLERLQSSYRELGCELKVYYGLPLEIIPAICQEEGFSTVFTNRDYEPYALDRDKYIFETLQKQKVNFIGAKDHVIFEKNEVLKDDGKPYTVFTPYSRKWKAKLNEFFLSSYPIERYTDGLIKSAENSNLPDLESMGFTKEQINPFPATQVNDELLKHYAERRNIPALSGTSLLSVHLRFGTISIRELARQALDTSETFLNELIWRDFYQMILFHFPHVVNSSFKSAYDRIEWEQKEDHFQAWCEGKTGYPLVDAGMRELNATGFMHNRVRMVVASFLTKHLLIDWRWGEAYFAEKLLDFELASNNGGWQWAASSGCDASPYFRIFNPSSQLAKFDKDYVYVKKWVPEFETETYPKPIVDHATARERALSRYKSALTPQ